MTKLHSDGAHSQAPESVDYYEMWREEFQRRNELADRVVARGFEVGALRYAVYLLAEKTGDNYAAIIQACSELNSADLASLLGREGE